MGRGCETRTTLLNEHQISLLLCHTILDTNLLFRSLTALTFQLINHPHAEVSPPHTYPSLSYTYLGTRSTEHTPTVREQWASIITLFAPLGIVSDRRRRMSGVSRALLQGGVAGGVVGEGNKPRVAHCIYENELLRQRRRLRWRLRLRCAIC